MRSLRLYGSADLRLVDEPAPTPGPDEELVRVSAVGICGSDLHWYAESGIGDAVLSRPLVLGHEAGGVIVGGPRTGQRVAIDPAIPCDQCEQCAAGHQHLCLALRFAGHGTTDGAFRELLAWPSRCLVPVPDVLDDEDVAMLEPLGVALHGLGLGDVRPGSRVGVFGCGPIGLFLVQLARAAGATTILATDVLPHRVDAARRAGATTAVLVRDGAGLDELNDATDGRGIDVAFEAAGENDAFETGIAVAAPLGQVIVVGIPSVDRTTFTASVARRKGLTIKLSRRMNRVYPRAVSLVERGVIDVQSVVTASLPLDRYDEAFGVASRREGLKVVVRP
ncbi:MAG TPA: alcohol dehydrogenase catalytic domain-containing protein [Candidatus Limnocylindrales bacterium]